MKRISLRLAAIGWTSSLLMPKAAVNQTEFAALSIRRPYHPSISDLARGENTLTAEFAFIASAGFGVSLCELVSSGPEIGISLQQFPKSEILLGGFGVGYAVSHIGLPEKTRRREVGRTRPDFYWICTSL